MNYLNSAVINQRFKYNRRRQTVKIDIFFTEKTLENWNTLVNLILIHYPYLFIKQFILKWKFILKEYFKADLVN